MISDKYHSFPECVYFQTVTPGKGPGIHGVIGQVWGHPHGASLFPLHAGRVCVSMLTSFCPCCATPALPLTAFTYSNLLS